MLGEGIACDHLCFVFDLSVGHGLYEIRSFGWRDGDGHLRLEVRMR